MGSLWQQYFGVGQTLVNASWFVLISVSSLTTCFNVENGQFDHLCRLNIKSELFPLDICWLGNNWCCLMGCPQEVWLLSARQAHFFFTAEVFWTRKQMDHSETHPQISWRAESARIKVHFWVGSNRVKEFFFRRRYAKWRTLNKITIHLNILTSCVMVPLDSTHNKKGFVKAKNNSQVLWCLWEGDHTLGLFLICDMYCSFARRNMQTKSLPCSQR